MNLFRSGKQFVLSSGMIADWKIDCDALTDDDWETLAKIISRRITFKAVVGVPTGGNKLAEALDKYSKDPEPYPDGYIPPYPVLLVDDVITTGNSMNEWRDKIIASGERDVVGFVVFSRQDFHNPFGWIHVLFQYNGPFID